MRKRLPMVDARALGANCDVCPYDGQRPTLPDAPPDPRVTVLLEGAGDIEEIVGKAAQGHTGAWLNKVWRTLNVDRKEAAVRNAAMCAPGKKHDEGSLRAAVEACRPRLARELHAGQLQPLRGSVAQRHLVLVCGPKALQSVAGKTSIDDWRGFPIEPVALRTRERGAEGLLLQSDVLLQSQHVPDNAQGGLHPLDNYVFFPTYHPAFIMRRPQYEHIFRRDLRVAWDYVHGKIAPLQWPTLYLDNDSAAEAFLFSICERLESGEDCDVGVDVETAGDWTTRLLLVGIATEDGSASLLFPFANEHIDAYVRFILAHPNATLVVQNGNHDGLSLERNGFRLSPRRWDTIVASRVVYPDLPHDLGFLATLFFFVNRWKSEFHAGSSLDRKGGETWEKYLQPTWLDRFLKYNACDALSQILLKRPLERRLAHVPKGN